MGIGKCYCVINSHVSSRQYYYFSYVYRRFATFTKVNMTSLQHFQKRKWQHSNGRVHWADFTDNRESHQFIWPTRKLRHRLGPLFTKRNFNIKKAINNQLQTALLVRWDSTFFFKLSASRKFPKIRTTSYQKKSNPVNHWVEENPQKLTLRWLNSL